MKNAPFRAESGYVHEYMQTAAVAAAAERIGKSSFHVQVYTHSELWGYAPVRVKTFLKKSEDQGLGN